MTRTVRLLAIGAHTRAGNAHACQVGTTADAWRCKAPDPLFATIGTPSEQEPDNG